MQQQINLFKFVVKPVKSFLELKTLLSIFGIIAGSLLLITVIQAGTFFYHSAELKKVTAQANAQRNVLIELAKKYPNNSFATQVIDASKLAACKIRFSTYLTAIAEAIVPGVWLVSFKISENGKQLELDGRGYRAEQIQTYLDNLKKSKGFSGLTFTLEHVTEAGTKAPAENAVKVIGNVAPTPILGFSIFGKSKAHG